MNDDELVVGAATIKDNSVVGARKAANLGGLVVEAGWLVRKKGKKAVAAWLACAYAVVAVAGG